MRQVTFITNRPPMTGGFGPPPPCGGPDLLSFGAASVAASADPARGGQVASPVTTAGALGCAPGTAAPALVAFLTQALRAASDADRTPLFVVHGYSTCFTDALTRTADVCECFEASDTPLQLAPIVLTWPSVVGLTSDNYLGDRGRAEGSAQALATAFRALIAAWEAAARPRSYFLAHSMGTWVTQNAMRALAAGPPLAVTPFEQSIVVGGDADVDALEAGQGLDTLARLSGWLTIGVNRTDFATGVASADILKRPRLGSSGPASIARIPANVRVVDYTLAVAADGAAMPPGETAWNYKLHQYYRTIPAVRDDLAAILVGTPPDEIGGRMTADALRQCGTPGIRAGRLYCCPPPPPPPADDSPDRR